MPDVVAVARCTACACLQLARMADGGGEPIVAPITVLGGLIHALRERFRQALQIYALIGGASATAASAVSIRKVSVSCR
jgi:hypothetical protein